MPDPSRIYAFGAVVATLRENVPHNMAVDIGEAIVTTLAAKGEAFVIQSKLVQQRGVQIVDVYRVAGHVVAIVVCLAVGQSRFDAAAGQHHRKAAAMVIAAIVFARESTLTIGGASEFAAPD